jgi:hypothetical protein
MEDFTETHVNDEELADFTDALLEGREPRCEMEDLSSLERTVLLLARVLRPEAPPADLQKRVRKRTLTEWERLHRSDQLPRNRWWPRSFPRLALGFALALILIVVGVFLLGPVEDVGLTATASGDWGLAVLILGVLGILALGILWLRHLRR